ncbi:GntR family transcriptional regulator [Pseudoflavonifractor phocaeensis]|uniref:GntR family transcriptional regulator n=1 Tax=Pseudoflavonifractor phocaeensis TaxID=1870988 RepID=UPI003085F692|nr:GntR family transcriptional regulator [Oscillospiraceae bacterium]
MAKNALKNVAYEYLLNAIMSYELKPGQVIVEQEVSDQLGISRTPIREAFKQLESEGLVHHFPSRGTFVTNLTVQDVEEIFQLREMFELTALKSAIHRITEEELRYIEGRLRYLDDKKSEEPSTKEEFYGSDRELHELIMKYSGNSRMVKFHRTLEAQLERLRRISSMTPMRLSKSRQEHLDILNALSDRDLDAATDALRLHLRNIKSSTLAVCRSQSVVY